MAPFVFSLVMLLALTQLYVEKLPPTIILPSDCSARDVTKRLDNHQIHHQILNVVSLVPFIFNLMILDNVAQLYVRNIPPAIILPSDCSAIVVIILSSPLEDLLKSTS
jgi:hypothetical protein